MALHHSPHQYGRLRRPRWLLASLPHSISKPGPTSDTAGPAPAPPTLLPVSHQAMPGQTWAIQPFLKAEELPSARACLQPGATELVSGLLAAIVGFPLGAGRGRDEREKCRLGGEMSPEVLYPGAHQALCPSQPGSLARGSSVPSPPIALLSPLHSVQAPSYRGTWGSTSPTHPRFVVP